MNRRSIHSDPATQPKRRFGAWMSCWIVLALLFGGFTSELSAQSTLRFMPPLLPKEQGKESGAASQQDTSRTAVSDLADQTPLPSPTGRTMIRFGSPQPVPSGQSNEEAGVANTLRPLQEHVPEVPSEEMTLRFTPRLQAPLKLNTARPGHGVNQSNSNASVPIDNPFTPAPMPLPEPVDQRQVEQVIEQGIQLETESRWADVLTHYETALRLYRNDTKLMERFRLARFHYDIGRRCHDNSYLGFVHTTKFLDALKLFDEIISRIQTNYVDMPHWDELFRYGVQDVEIALHDPLFLSKSNLTAMPEKVDAYLRTMRTTVDGWEIRNREDMKNGILRLAEIGMHQLGLNPVVLLMEFTCGMVNSLDPYTSYLTPNQLSDTFSMISGNFVGLGVELKSDRESLLIVRVIQGSPAREAGLQDGDRIHTVDGISTKGRDTDSAADLLQGPEGSTLKLMVQSPGKKSREIQITRRKIDVPSVENVQMLDETLGYIKLTGFQSKTGVELKKAISELDRRGMRRLVLDLRHNPGGLLQIGVEVANLFLEEGAIVRTRGRHNTMDTPYMATREDTWKMPLIVLIDEESASASEIVAGAIRDHGRGVIVGKRSYGKGTIQAILSVNGGQAGAPQAGLRLTVEKFYSPLGWPYSCVGVTPDYEVETPERVDLARQIQGRLPTPVFSRTVSSSTDDPFIKKAIEISKTLNSYTAARP